MGLAPTVWMKAIDTYGAATADKPALLEPGHFKHIETETYGAALPATNLPQEAKK
jgi:hypothetical protein